MQIFNKNHFQEQILHHFHYLHCQTYVLNQTYDNTLNTQTNYAPSMNPFSNNFSGTQNPQTQLYNPTKFNKHILHLHL